MLNKLLVISIFLITTIFPFPVNAQGGIFKLNQPEGLGIKAPFQEGNTPHAEGLIEKILVNVITIFFAVGGIGVVVYFVWGAVDWILSGGDKEKTANARKKMTHAIIGLVLLSLSFVIINIIGQVAGFNPLGSLQLRGLGEDPSSIAPN